MSSSTRPSVPTTRRARSTGPRPTSGPVRRSLSPHRPEPVGRRARWPWLTVAGTLLVVVILVAVSVAGRFGPAPARAGDPARQPAPTAVTTALASVPAAVLAQIGVPKDVTIPQAVVGPTVPVLEGPGAKPEVLYVGAEYCPYCAAERWALITALSQFGTFHGLKVIHSSPGDPAGPDTPTLSFVGATYTSPWIDFVPVELYTTDAGGGTIRPLMHLTPAEQALVHRYDGAPYTTQPGAIPFIDVANRYVQVGAAYSPLVLSGLSQTAIAGQLGSARTPLAATIDGSADGLVKRICSVTGDAPAACQA